MKCQAKEGEIPDSIQRNFGLDIIRSIAILMVLIGHLIPDNTSNKFLYVIAMIFRGYGVALFFVLSGFLIGQILIRLFNKGLNISNIKNFYIRRWFRTLPLYYLALTFFLCILKISQPETNIFSLFYLKYLFFIQNFDIRHMCFFNHSWSLSIEEWFYLLLPLTLVVIKEREEFSKIKFLKIPPSLNENLYIDLLVIIIFIALIRFFYVWGLNVVDGDFGVRRQIPISFDSLLTGVLFACLKINNENIYKKFLNSKTIILSSAILCILVFCSCWTLLFKKLLLSYFIFSNTFFWSILSFSFVLIVIFFENNELVNKKLPKIFIIKHFFEKTSIYSYSMYLFHTFIIALYRIFYDNLEKSSWGTFLCILTIYFVSAFIYRYYEKPIMNFRDRF